ncbi:MAG: HlyC/CorC family transporter [Oscillospiraceae bacterium]|nr:HlyC/CorC family transporter [Oscillospiraceae bacterium]
MDILIIVVLVIFSAVFSATETAFSSVNRIRLKNLASNGNSRAAIALDVLEKFDKALTAILIGNNVVNIASSSLTTVVFMKYLGEGSVGVATAVMTVTVLIFGEITPKGLAKEHAEGFVLFMAPLLAGFMFIITPVVMPFLWLKRGVSKLFGSADKQPTMTEDELKYIIDEIQDEGVLEQQESDLVRSALEFDEKTVGEILVPRVNITGVDVNDNLDDIKQAFIESNCSRLPVFEDSIDNIIGVLLLGDFYKLYLEGGSDIRPILMEPAHLIEHTRVSQALKTMQKEKMHMAVVHDEYGGTQGIVTLEDIIEELVGEIYDESDTEDEQIYFKQISDNEYEVDAEMSIYDMLERMELPGGFIESEMASLGGYVMELAGEIPQANEVVSDDKVDLTVLESDEHKIYRVKVKLREETKQDE